MTHIGLNLVYLVPSAQGGMETYARELVPRLVEAAPQHTFTSFINRDAAATGGPWFEHTRSVVIPVSARSRVQWVRGEQQMLPPRARCEGVELLHSFASTAPAWGPFVRVTTIHDLIYRTMPEAHPGLRSLGMRVLVPLAARRSERIIVPSHATADDIASALHVARERIDVVPEGLGTTPGVRVTDVRELRSRLNAGTRPIVLSVSAKLAHKNLRRLIGAFAGIPHERRPLLVLPGYPTVYEAQLRDHATEMGVSDDVRFLGWVSGEVLEGLYQVATCVLFPTLAEGFGLPVLEAMARGVAVGCSDIPVLREVGGHAALFFDPCSEMSIAEAMQRLCGDQSLRERLAAAGRARAQSFSWRAAATAPVASYERALRYRA